MKKDTLLPILVVVAILLVWGYVDRTFIKPRFPDPVAKPAVTDPAAPAAAVPGAPAAVPALLTLTPAAPPILASRVSLLNTLFIPELPQRPPRA